jgi:hypothetical protein
MTYELSIELKNAGFPQKGDWYYGMIAGEPIIFTDYDESCFNVEKLCVAPTLEELIEACGDGFYRLMRISDKVWDVKGEGVKDWCSGSTPSEAVANLWLALNKK